MVDRAHKPAAITAKSPGALPQPIIDVDADKVIATLPNGESVTVLLYGATVVSWKSANGTENLWVSEKADLSGRKPVRGGIPVVFPVFGPPPKDHAASQALAQHGFARNNRWEYLGKTTSESSTSSEANVKLDFGLYSANLDDATRKAWAYEFGLVYSVTLSKGALQTMVQVSAPGESQGFEFQVLLHTYLKIKDISKTQVTGLLGVNYTDKVLNATSHTQSSPNLSITGETDRVYHKIPQNTTTVIEDGQPRFDVVRDNLEDTVIWNPWVDKAKGMGDFEPKEGYKNMICVEVGAVTGWTKIEAGETWEGGQVIKSLL